MPQEHPDRPAQILIYTGLVSTIKHQIELNETGMTQAEFNDFRNREILTFVTTRFLLDHTALHYVSVGKNRESIVARTNAGTRYLIIGYSNNRNEFIVRGVLKQKRPGIDMSYLMNGQAGKNAKQVLHFDETACIIQPPMSPKAYLSQKKDLIT
jgi:hypothetical protein